MYQFFWPEGMYNLEDMYRQKLCWYYENNSAVTGKVIRMNQKKHYFLVDLGGNFVGKLPFEESTIYPVYKSDGSLSANVYSLLGKKIQVKITKIEGFCKIFLSRKQNMEDILFNIKNNTEFDYAEIVSYTKHSAFVDVGSGIIGRISFSGFSPILYHDIRELEIPIGTIIPVQVTNYNPNTKYFTLVRNIPDAKKILKSGETTIVKIFDEANDPDGIGYYCLVKSKIKGIIDSPDCKLNYGDIVIAKVKNITPQGKVHLNFIRKLR